MRLRPPNLAFLLERWWLLSAEAAGLFWVIDAALDAALFSQGSFPGGLFSAAGRELFIRGCGALITGGLVAGMGRLLVARKAEDRLKANRSAALSEIGRIASSSHEIDEVFERIAQQMTRLVPADGIGISLVDAETGSFDVRCRWGRTVEGRSPGEPISLEGSLTGHVFRTGATVLWPSDEATDRLVHNLTGFGPMLRDGVRSVIAAPLIVRDGVIGQLQWSTWGEPFTPQDRDIAEAVAAQIAGAVANAELHARVNRQAREEKILADIGRTTSSTLDVREVYAAVAGRVRDLLPFDRMTAVEIDLDQDEFTVAYTAGAEVPEWPAGTTRPLRGSFVEHSCKTARAQLIRGEKFRGFAERFPAARGTCEKYGSPCRILVPLVHDDRVIAVLIFFAHELETLGERELALAVRVGAQISGAVANAGLYAEISRAWAELDVRAVAMETAADMIMISARDGAIEYVNEAFVDGTGYSREETVGRNPRFLASGKQDPAFYEKLWDTILDGRVWQGTLINRRKDGSEYPDLMSITPLVGEGGEVVRFIAIKRDITDQIEAAQERELRLILDHENRELQRVNEARAEFLSTVSHELKTPLTSIVAFADILSHNREGNLSDREMKHIHVIRRNSHRLKALIEDLLDVSRIESGQFVMKFEEIDIQTVLEETVESLRPITDARDQELNVNVPSADLRIIGDPTRIAQVIANLVSNASKYSSERSEIVLAVCDLGHEIEITVRDRGIGISKADQKRLFTPFFRATNKKVRSISGTGLGLIIVKSIVEAHDGTITVDSKSRRGTEVRVTFARRPADELAARGSGNSDDSPNGQDQSAAVLSPSFTHLNEPAA